VLLLDEATSALDAQNEKVVQESLDTIMKGKTSIVIAHRYSTIKDADEILVFSEEGIVEQGNYETLYAKKGHFYRLENGQWEDLDIQRLMMLYMKINFDIMKEWDNVYLLLKF